MQPALTDSHSFCTDNDIALLDPAPYTLWRPKQFQLWSGTGAISEVGFTPDEGQPNSISAGVQLGCAAYVEHTLYGGLYIVNSITYPLALCRPGIASESGSNVMPFTIPSPVTVTFYSALQLCRAVSADILRAVGLDPETEWDQVTPGAFCAEWAALETLKRIYTMQAAETATGGDDATREMAIAAMYSELAARSAARMNFEYVDNDGNSRLFSGGEARLKRV